ncbi:MAG: cytochrome [Myxococcaceae bacterium]|nr:cytochrome [Myxococcaceae bacterium]
MTAKMTMGEFFGGLLAPPTIANPYPFYEGLRAKGPILVEAPVPLAVFTRNAAVLAALQDKRFSNDWPSSYRFARPLDAAEEIIFQKMIRFFQIWMQGNDGAKHVRLRGLVQRAFTPKMLERMEQRITSVVDGLLAEMKSKRECDYVADFARPFPEVIIGEMFGLPKESSAEFTRTANAIFGFIGIVDPPAGALQHIESQLNQVRDYLEPIIEDRKKHPAEDMISVFVHPDANGDVMSTEEIVVQCSMMLAAGHETTATLVANGLLALLRHPDQKAKLAGDPALAKSAVEECLRYDSPSLWTPRIAAEDFEYEGAPLKKGQPVWLGLASANHDPDSFDTPATFDITRKAGKMLTLGWGPHYCIGAALARMEAQIALNRTLAMLPNPELATPTIEWQPNFMLRSPKALPIRFD